MEKYIGIIPARYASTRFPGKPLADLGGKTMIERVYDSVAKVLEWVVVATDDPRIVNAVKQFGGNVIMTSANHKSGTDRCSEALSTFERDSNKKFEVVINIQGDEPFIHAEQIESICSCFASAETAIATLIKPIEENAIIFDPNRPKVVVDKQGCALYFSRSPIPFVRDEDKLNWHSDHTFFQHIGLYGYRSDILREITQLQQGLLEKTESLEQLRWLENGYKIQTAITKYESYGIDTPGDLERAIRLGLID